MLKHGLLLSLILPRPSLARAPSFLRLLRGRALEAACAIGRCTSAALLLPCLPCSRLAKRFVCLSRRVKLLLRPESASVAPPASGELLVELLDPVHARAVDAVLLDLGNRLRATCVGALACAHKHEQIC